MRRQHGPAPASALIGDDSRRDLRHPAATGPSLDRATLAIPNWTSARQPHMPNLSRKIVSASVESPVDDDSSAKSCAHRQEDHIVASMARAIPELRDGSRIGVVLDVAPNAELSLENRFDRNIDPRCKIGRRLNSPAHSIERAAAAYADAAYCRIRKPALLHNGGDPLLYKVERAVGTFGGQRRELKALADIR
jgi:hypothetical protein